MRSGGVRLRLALALSPNLSAVADYLRGLPDLEVVREVQNLNREALASLVDESRRPAVVIVDEDLAEDDADISLTDFIYSLRRQNIRVIFIATRSRPGDTLLADLVRLDITDIVDGAELSLDGLLRMLERKTPFSEVSHLLDVDVELPTADQERKVSGRPRLFSVLGRRGQNGVSPSVGTSGGETSSQRTRVIVKEKIVERVVPGDPGRSVTAVFGLGPSGVGATTVAVNLACVMAGGRMKVALVDLDPAWSAIPILLGLTPQDGVGALMSPGQLSAAGQTKCGVTVFGSLPYPEPPRARSLAESDVLYLIDRLGAFDRVVVDVGHDHEHPVARTVMRIAQKILLVTDLDANHMLIAVHKLGIVRNIANPEKLQLVINNVPATGKQARVRDAAALLQFERNTSELPYCPMAVHAAVQGEPLVTLLGSDQPYVAAIRALAGIGESPAPKRVWWPFS